MSSSPDTEPSRAEDPESPPLHWLAEGLAVSQRVMVVALAMALPVLVGFGIDRWMGTRLPVGILLGCGLGMLSAGWQLWELLRWLERRPRRPGTLGDRVLRDPARKSAGESNARELDRPAVGRTESGDDDSGKP